MPNKEAIRELMSSEITEKQILTPRELKKITTDEWLTISKKELEELGISSYDQLLLFSRILLNQLRQLDNNYLVNVCANSVLIVSLSRHWQQNEKKYREKGKKISDDWIERMTLDLKLKKKISASRGEAQV